MTETILVLGSSGKTGRRVCAKLEARGVDVRPAGRNTPIPFDWEDRATWPDALADVEAVYLLHPQAGGPDAIPQIKAFAEAAFQAGVRKAVLISVPDDGTEYTESAQETENTVSDSGLALTTLRLRWFMQNFSEGFLLDAVRSGEIRAPAGDGKEPFVDAEDISDVAVEALLDPSHDGKTYELTGPRLLSFAEVADEITASTGQSVKYVPISAEQYVVEQEKLGVPREEAAHLAEVYRVIADKRIDRVTHDVERVLGRPARDFGDFIPDIKSNGAV